MAEIGDPIERLLVLQRVIEGRVVERHRLRVSTVARDLVAKGARLLGGCCGTTPAHIAALSKMIIDIDPR